MKSYKFLDVGCKVGGSFDVSKEFGYKKEEGLGIDISESHVKNFIDAGYNGMVADATNLPFEDNSFELSIFNHVIEHLADEETGKKALDECLRVSSKYVFLGLPYFDADEYLNSLGFKLFFSDWTGHRNKVHLKKIQEEYLKNYNYELKLNKKITDSHFPEILPLDSQKDSHHYNEKIHGYKEKISFTEDVWRDITILIKI